MTSRNRSFFFGTPGMLPLLLPFLLLGAGCDDDQPSAPPPDPSALTPPPAGAGAPLTTPAISGPVGTEEQDCYFFRVSDLATAGGLDPTKPFNLHRVEVAQRAGSHHMN